jgi:hypothetical protein
MKTWHIELIGWIAFICVILAAFISIIPNKNDRD